MARKATEVVDERSPAEIEADMTANMVEELPIIGGGTPAGAPSNLDVLGDWFECVVIDLDNQENRGTILFSDIGVYKKRVRLGAKVILPERLISGVIEKGTSRKTLMRVGPRHKLYGNEQAALALNPGASIEWIGDQMFVTLVSRRFSVVDRVRLAGPPANERWSR
jgi:hypothetical protein